jgi:hypothetical protein
MHKKISSRLAIEIIALLAILVGGYALIGSGIFGEGEISNIGTISPMPTKNSREVAVKNNNSCKTHFYKGEAEISGWYVNTDDEWFLVVSDVDIEKLPKYDGTEEYKLKNKKIKLVDVTSQIEKKLKLTSEKKPATITITGYMTRCEGVPLASLEYKENIFKKYLNI